MLAGASPAGCTPTWLCSQALHTPCHTLLPSPVGQLGYYFSPKESQAGRDVLITPLQRSCAVWHRETFQTGIPSVRREHVRTVGSLQTWMGNSEPELEEPNAIKRLLCCLALVGGEGERDLEHRAEPRVAAWLTTKTFLCRMGVKQGEDCASKGSFLMTQISWDEPFTIKEVLDSTNKH